MSRFDSPAQVYANPASIFVAGFIGSPAMNFFSARLEQRDGELRVTANGLDLPLPAEIVARAGGQTVKAVILGVRPEDIHDGRRVIDTHKIHLFDPATEKAILSNRKP